MNESTVDAVSRRARAAVSRRRSVLTLGGAVLAAMIATPGSGMAGKNRKNRKNTRKAKKQVFALCQQQVGECQTFMNAACNGPGCGEIVAVCCPLLGTCQNEAFFTCIVDATSAPEPEAIGSSPR